MSEQRHVIQFYSTTDEYGCFSNFAHSWFKLKGKSWPTVEHYFQAQKFFGTDYEEAIREAKSPMIAVALPPFCSISATTDRAGVSDA